MGSEFGQIILQQKKKAPEETLRSLFSSYIKRVFQPLDIQETVVFGVRGYVVSLPITLGELKVYYEKTKPKLKDIERETKRPFMFSRKHLLRITYNNLQNCYIRLLGRKLKEALKKYHIKYLSIGKYEQRAVKSLLWNEVGMIEGDFFFCQGQMIRRIFLEQWLENVLSVHGIRREELRLMIIDDETTDHLDACIEQLTLGLNHLTIMTKRRAYYQDMCDFLFKENGLVVEIADALGSETGQGHVLIDFACNQLKDYQWYPKNLVVMPVKELPLSKEELRMRRKDICVEEGEFLILDNEKRNVILAEAAFMKMLEDKSWRNWLNFKKKDGTIIDT